MRRALPAVIIIALVAAAVWYFTTGVDTPNVDPSSETETSQTDSSDPVRTSPDPATAESGSTDAKPATGPPADPEPDVVADSDAAPVPDVVAGSDAAPEPDVVAGSDAAPEPDVVAGSDAAPGADGDSPVDAIADGDGVVAEVTRVDETLTEPIPPPDSTVEEEQSLAHAPEASLTQDSGTIRDSSQIIDDDSSPLAVGPTSEEPDARVPGTGPEADQVVESSTRTPPQPIPAGRGDQSVTPERVVSLIPDETVERVRIREADGDDRSNAASSATGPIEEGQPASATTEPPGQEPAGAARHVVAEVGSEADQVVKSSTRPPPQPIPADRGDQSVTPERVVSLIPDETVERVRIQEADGDDRSSAASSATGPIEEEQPASAATEPPGQEPADAARHVVAEVGSAAQPVVESSTRPPPQPIPAGRGDQSVAPERVVSLIPDETVERVRIQEADGDDGSSAASSATGPVEEGQPASATTEPPGQEPADDARHVVAEVGSEAQPVVESSTRPPPQPIPAGRGDQSVTPERVVSLIPEDTVERVRTREADGDDGSSADSSATGPVEEGQPASATAEPPRQEPADTAAHVVAEVGSEAQPVVESSTRPPPQPIPAGRGDQSVTPERVVSLIPDETVERVRIQEADGDDGSSAAPSATGPVEEEQPASATTEPPRQESADTAAHVVAEVGPEAQPVVESSTRPPPQPIPAGRGDQSVTPEQVVSVVPDDTVERVRIRRADGDDDTGADSPDADPADAGDKDSATTLADVGEKVATTLAGVAADLGSEVKQIVDSLTGTGPTPTPPDPDGDTVSGEPVSQPRPTDGAESLVSRATVPSQPESGGTRRDTIPEPGSDIRTEAEKFVDTLKEPAPQPIPADRADHFVTQEQVISLVPDDIIERVTVRELAEDDAISGDTPITVVRETEQIETVTQERLIAESGGNVETPIVVPQPSGDQSGQTTIGDILADQAHKPGALIQVVRTVRHFEVTTLEDLLDSEPSLDSLLRVIRQPYRIETATLADLLQKQLDEDPDSIFYLHTVLPTDDQGIWGIVHFGIIDNFARGVAIRRGERVELYTVRIPRDADERLGDNSSSFLGKLIDEKTKESYVYNFREHRVGRNPDRIYPGQELVIINFKSEELAAIYEHFASG